MSPGKSLLQAQNPKTPKPQNPGMLLVNFNGSEQKDIALGHRYSGPRKLCKQTPGVTSTQVCGVWLMKLGMDFAYNESMNIIGFARPTAYYLTNFGALILLSSGIGWAAAQTKSDVLAAIVSTVNA